MPGPYFEQISADQTFEHSIRPTITEADHVLIITITRNPAAFKQKGEKSE